MRHMQMCAHRGVERPEDDSGCPASTLTKPRAWLVAIKTPQSYLCHTYQSGALIHPVSPPGWSPTSFISLNLQVHFILLFRQRVKMPSVSQLLFSQWFHKSEMQRNVSEEKSWLVHKMPEKFVLFQMILNLPMK